MDKVQYKINNMLQILKNMVKRFPVTIVLIFVVSIIYAFCLDEKYLSNEIVNKIMEFSVIFGSSTYLLESITKKNDKKKIFIYILFFIFIVFSMILLTFSGVCAILMVNTESVFILIKK